jgi:hypothetical protein
LVVVKRDLGVVGHGTTQSAASKNSPGKVKKKPMNNVLHAVRVLHHQGKAQSQQISSVDRRECVKE